MSAIILTPMEELICRLKVHGFQRKEIANYLHRSENTLIVHNKHIHTKLNANNDVEVVTTFVAEKYGIDIRKIIQICILLALLVPSILSDGRNYVRVLQSYKIARTATLRRSEPEPEYTLQ
jgi:DNA-binding CsgD family transcriptional regulator